MTPSNRFPALAVLVCLVAWGCSDLDVVTGSYSTMAEVRDAGAIDRGWIPPILPAGATDIRAAHDPKRDRHWGLFSFPPEDRDALRQALQADEVPLNGLHCDIPPRIEWWPVLLRGTLDGEQIKTAGLMAYRSRRGGLIVAVNWNQGRAYYWKAS